MADNVFDQFDAPNAQPSSANPFNQISAAPSVAAPPPVAPAVKPVSQELGAEKSALHNIDRLASGLKWGANELSRLYGAPEGMGAGDVIDKLGQFVGLPSTEQANATNEKYIQQREKSEAPGTIGEIAGDAPFVAAMPGGVGVSSALSGMVLGDSKTPLGVAEDAGEGYLFGKAGDYAVRGLGRVISPVVSPAVKMLKDMGVTLTPGQILGGFGKRLEDAAASVPFMGDAIQGAQRRSITSFNRGVINKALQPIGQQLPKGMPAGHEAVAKAGDLLGDAYNALLPNLTASADKSFAQGILNARQNLPRGVLNDFDDVLRDKVLSRFTMSPVGQGQNAVTLLGQLPQGTATLTGEALKDMESVLGQRARMYQSAPDPDQRLLGQAFGSVRSELRDLLTRQNPQAADQLGKINKGWALLTRIEGAAGKTSPLPGEPDSGGVFTPQQLITAVRQADPSMRKRAFARGDALLQDLAEAGKSTLPSSVPDSGTARRMLTSGAVLGTGAGLLHLLEPTSLATVLGGIAGYSKAGIKALGALLTERPQAAPAIAHAIVSNVRAPAAAAATAAGMTASQPAAASGYAEGGRVDHEASKADRAPTDAQKEAGNYRKAHISMHGLPIAIETAKGVERTGVGADGKPWANRNHLAHYGYVKRTEGADGDHVDIYVGPHHKSRRMFVVDQIDPQTKKFDEHKAIIGARTLGEAKAIYDAGFSDSSGPRRRWRVHALDVDGFKRWLESGSTKRPFRPVEDRPETPRRRRAGTPERAAGASIG